MALCSWLILDSNVAPASTKKIDVHAIKLLALFPSSRISVLILCLYACEGFTVSDLVGLPWVWVWV
jgi:hypothetical protein